MLVHDMQGFAYVEFETRDGLQNAVDMTGVELDGRSLQIKIADIRGGVPGGGYQGGYQGGRGNFAGGTLCFSYFWSFQGLQNWDLVPIYDMHVLWFHTFMTDMLAPMDT